MKKSFFFTVQKNDAGQYIIPQELAEQFGFADGAKMRVDVSDTEIILSRSTFNLNKIYVEATNACNLGCRTCMRNAWDEPLGQMEWRTYEAVLQGAASCSPLPLLFFGGFGEPLAHPELIRMIAAARGLGIAVELITNGTLLTEKLIQPMIECGVQRVWVSIDGASRESYTDVRLGDQLASVIHNVSLLNSLRKKHPLGYPKIGVAFVAMRRNLHELPEVIRLGKQLGADRFSVSNVYPHTRELVSEGLYARAMQDGNLQSSVWSTEISLPRMDLDANVLDVIGKIYNARTQLQVSQRTVRTGGDSCPFAESGSLAVRWDGEVSPCLPLLHTHENYLCQNLRVSQSFSFGNVNAQPLRAIWERGEYQQFRERLLQFDFSPCVFCNSCNMAEANLEDCFGNLQPACGGCLWAQGFIQCP